MEFEGESEVNSKDYDHLAEKDSTLTNDEVLKIDDEKF